MYSLVFKFSDLNQLIHYRKCSISITCISNNRYLPPNYLFLRWYFINMIFGSQLSLSTRCISDGRVNTYAVFQVSSLPSSFTYKVCSRCLFNCGQKHVASKRIIFQVVCTDCKSRRKNYQWTLLRYDSSRFVPQDIENLILSHSMI